MGKISALCSIKEPNSITDEKLKQFYTDVAVEFMNLNALIENYNKEENYHKKRLFLYQLYQAQKALSSRFPQQIIASCPEYQQKIHHKLFKEIKDEFTYLDVSSLQEHSLEAQLASRRSPFDPTSLPELIANMPPEKVDSLLKILFEGANFNRVDLINLYSPLEEGYKDFQMFLHTHTIMSLGGVNSHNFKITNTRSGKNLVLKIDFREKYPRHADIHLRKRSLENVCTPIWAERDARFVNNKNQQITRSLLVTDYCQGSDLENHAQLSRPINELISLALNIYLQMANLLRNIVRDGCAFTDMKNSNWLIDNGVLKLADTKSFLFIDESGLLDMTIPDNYWFYGITGTVDLIPPELNCRMPPPSSADKAHTFMLGKNLYQFLTRAPDLDDVIGKKTDFSDPIFLTPSGTLLKSLIEKLTQEDSKQRPSMDEVINELTKIKTTHEFLLALEYYQLYISQFRQYKRGFNDLEIDKAISGAVEYLATITYANDIPLLEQKLKAIKDTICENMKFGELKKACVSLLKEIKTFQFGEADLEMAQFRKKNLRDIDKATTKEELEQIKLQLKSHVTQMAKHPVIKEMHDIIAKFRNECHFYTIGMKAKAQRIEAAMAKVPVLERFHIAHQKSALGNMVLQELASHRHPFREGPMNKSGEFNTTQTARTYRLFTEKFPRPQSEEMPTLVATMYCSRC
ncbi:MAG: hypothetical protein P4L79_12505 [Legionella sp.]|uniref:hypothetical protein n=1 Tax=Legionella sp. TaxID=459 RepID=UPI002844193E|nr:hypothetical protein [Legionella sp.]